MRLQETSIFFQNNRYRHYYLCHYLPLCSGIDTLSRSLLKFKRGAQPELDSFIDRALRGFHETPVVLPPETLIIRALRHKETQPVSDPPSSLDRLGHALARELQFPYLPGLLKKIRPTAINQSLTRRQRETQLKDIYRINPAALWLSTIAPTPQPSQPLNPPYLTRTQAPTPQPPLAKTSQDTAPTPPSPASILLLDDILTTGATILSILQTLHTAFPHCTVTVFTLAKTH